MSIPARVHFLRSLLDKHFIPTINATQAEIQKTQELRVYVPDGQRFKLGAVILIDDRYFHITRVAVGSTTKHRQPQEVVEQIQVLKGHV